MEGFYEWVKRETEVQQEPLTLEDEQGQLEYVKVMENRFLATSSVSIREDMRGFLDNGGIHPMVMLETTKWWVDDASGVDEHVIPHLWRMIRTGDAPTAYILGYIPGMIDRCGMTPRHIERAIVPMLSVVIGSASMDDHFRLRAIISCAAYLDEACFTQLVCAAWDHLETTCRIMLIEYLLKHPASYIQTGFPMERMTGFLAGVVSSGEDAPWDVADASRILLDCTDDPGVRDDAIRVLAGYKESRTFYGNRENIHCIATESAQEIIDFLVQDIPMLPNHPIQHYINELTSGRTDHRITASLRRIEIDPSTYGRHRHTLRQILAMVWAYIRKYGDTEGHDRESMIERLIQELVDMCGTCSTGHAVRLLNVLSGYRDFAIRVPPEHALRCRFFVHLNSAMMAIEDEDERSVILEEMTLPGSHHSGRMRFLGFLRDHLPKIKEDLYEEFKDQMSDTDFDLFLRKAIYYYEGETDFDLNHT